MKTLYSSIYKITEGILDIDLGDKLEQDMLTKFIEETFKGKYKLTKDKHGGFKATGTMILKGYQEAGFPSGFYISSLKGNMYIENCPNLESIGNLFGELRYDDVSLTPIEGILSIANCKSFNTLKGIPASVNELMLTDLPKLKSIEYLPKWAGAIMITKCGRKWTKEQISAKTGATRIMCSREEQMASITESMSDPILLRAHKYLIDNKIGFTSWPLMVGSETEIDKILPSQATHYSMPADKDACKKAVNLMQRYKTGFAIGFNEDDLVFIANSFCNIFTIHHDSRYSFQRSAHQGKAQLSPESYKPTEFIRTLFGNSYGSLTNVTDIYVYDVAETKGAWKKRQARADNRQGMITQASYELIARQNRERYKKALAKLKTLKASAEYIKFAQEIESRINKYSKLVVEIVRHPEKHDASHFNIVTQLINDLTTKFSSFVNHFKRNSMGVAGDYDRRELAASMKKCEQQFEMIDRYLNSI